MQSVLYLILVILFTKVGGHASVKLGQPAVLGKLLVGIILGPALLGWIDLNSHFIHELAEIGVLLLMFIAGLETDLEQLKRNWKSAFAVAVAGVIFPFIGGYCSAIAFGIEHNYAVFFGVLFCATSVSISVQVLKELNQLNSREGTTILGAAVVDDVLVVVLLACIMTLLGQGSDISIGLLIGQKILFFVIMIAASIWIVPKVMKGFAYLKITEAVMSGGLLVCFSFAYFAEYMQMAGIIGAFAAGIAISQTPFKHKVERGAEPIAYTIFVPIFFVSIGLSVSFDGISSQIGLLLVITIIAIVTKLIGGWAGARLTGFNHRASFAIGSGMISRGEVALIIASTGLQSGLLLPQYFTTVVFTIIITTLVAPPLLKIMFKPAAVEERALLEREIQM
ncbi:cation:proton antiporter [Paenibacillus sp. FSL R10-2734]|uniref:cation:proton antiporter n=1 Tax=Paenibacillus sp. FSL R10-2734 TaxID=2954691 RepID=UPI0030D7C159